MLSGTFFLFLLIIIIYYSGELIWRERDANVAQITDAEPVPSWVPFMSKLTALGGVQVVLLTVVLVCGIVITQTFKGYFHYEISLYIKTLFGMELPYLLLWCVAGHAGAGAGEQQIPGALCSGGILYRQYFSRANGL